MKKTLMKLRIMSMVLSLLFLCSCNRSVIEILDPVIKPESYTLHLPKESSIAFSGYAVDLEKLIYLRTLTLPQRKVEVFDLTTGNIMSDFNVKGNGNLG